MTVPITTMDIFDNAFILIVPGAMAAAATPSFTSFTRTEERRAQRSSAEWLTLAVIVDAHTDVLNELVVHQQGEETLPELVLRCGEAGVFERYWLPRLENGGVAIQICPLYGEGARRSDPRDRAVAQVAEFKRLVDKHVARLRHVFTRADLDDSRLRLVLSMEGAEPLEGDAGAFEEWFATGVRSASLTWNHANAFAGGIDSPRQGLTSEGRTLIRRFRELGVLLDLAHASEQTWRDVIEEDIGFSVTHAGCRAVCDHPRNLEDWQLEALAQRGGVLGLMALPFVIDRDTATLARWLDHFDHAVAVMGIAHVGVGADFVDQVTPGEKSSPLDRTEGVTSASAAKARLALEGFTGPEAFPIMVAALRERGYDGPQLDAITSGNWLRILRGTLPG